MPHTAEKPYASEIALRQFAADVRYGFTSKPKRIDSKYFYDTPGSDLFRQIMNMPEYYLTNCEYEIFDTYKNEILEIILRGADSFNLIEFGAGDGFKTKLLLKHFVSKDVEFRYAPIDISGDSLNRLVEDCRHNLPALNITPIQNDYFFALRQLHEEKHYDRDVVLFAGSSIGNFDNEDALNFLRAIRREMTSGDILIIGFDLKKDPDIILSAYNDKAGITRDFNFNLLHRINRELGGNFDTKHFKHFPIYDPVSGTAQSYLVCLEDHHVIIEKLHARYDFIANETIFTEISQKYDLAMISSFAKSSGFHRIGEFKDSRGWFVSEVWQAM